MKKQVLYFSRISLFIISLIINSQIFAQNITGKIIDGTTNEPMIGATVQLKGKMVGTVSDLEGNYSIQASPSDILIFSFTGYDKQEIPVGDKKVINVTLKESATQLAEVVSIGYATVKKSDLTGSVAVVTSKELTKNPASSAAQALQGKAPGVLVSQNGAPGGGATIRVRGVGSINKSADPIFILDGIQVPNINSIQPQDIETFQVLKDASASAIYGANGSNGVIIITTKRGKSGKPQVNFSSYLSLNMKPIEYDVMNAQQYSDFYSQVLYPEYGLDKTYNNAVNPAHVLSPEFRQKYYGAGWEQGTNWQSEIFKNGFNQNYNLSVAGGGENSNFNISFGYLNEDGTVIKNNYERYQIRANSDFKLSQHIKIGENLSASYSTRETPMTVQSSIYDLNTSPLMRIYNPELLGGYESYQMQYWYDINGNLTSTPQTGNGYLNTLLNDKPNLLAAPMNGSDLKYSTNTIASVYALIDVTPELSFKLTPAISITNFRSKAWLKKFEGNRFTGGADLKETYSESVDVNMESQVTFKKLFNNLHNVQATAVYTVRKQEVNIINGSANGFDFETLNTLTNGGTPTSPRIVTGSVEELRMISYLARVMYDYKSKYYLTGSWRSDGISLFGPGHRRGNFYSGSIAWKINEDFFKSVKQLDVLKLRLGWGQTGNSNIGSGFQYVNQISSPNSFYAVFGDDQHIAKAMYTFEQMGNPSIEWEKAEMINSGFDFTLFKYRLTGSVEYYLKNNKDLLVQVSPPLALGILPNSPYKPWFNAADIQNKGVELSLQWRDKVREFNYNIIGSLTTIYNTVKYMPMPNITGEFNRTIVGQPIGSLYGYVSEGIIQQTEAYYDKNEDGTINLGAYKFPKQEGVMPKPGDLKYSDLNGDGQVTALDKTIIGKTIPGFTYTLGFDCSYKNFDFSIFLFGIGDFDIYNFQRATLSSMNTQDQMHNKLNDFAKNHWTIENASTKYVRVDPSNTNKNDQISSFWVEDGSFLRIKDLQIGYNLPTKQTKTLGIGSVRIYANASNLYNFTNYKGRDPEGFVSDNPLNSGVDNGAYPMPRSFTFGLQVGF